MRRILGIVAAVVGPRALPVVTMDVLHPRRSRLLGENYVARFEDSSPEARRYTVEIANDGAMILDEHRRNRIELRREVEERECAERLLSTLHVHLMAVDVAH